MPEHTQWSDGRIDDLARDVNRLTDDIVPVVIEHSGALRSQGTSLKRIEKLLETAAEDARSKTWTTAQKISVGLPLSGTLATCVVLVLTKGQAGGP